MSSLNFLCFPSTSRHPRAKPYILRLRDFLEVGRSPHISSFRSLCISLDSSILRFVLFSCPCAKERSLPAQRFNARGLFFKQPQPSPSSRSWPLRHLPCCDYTRLQRTSHLSCLDCWCQITAPKVRLHRAKFLTASEETPLVISFHQIRASELSTLLPNPK